MADYRRDEELPTYSRRKSEPEGVEEKTPHEESSFHKVEVGGSHRFYILLFSLVLALTSVANPLLTDFGNAAQTTNLYTGQIMSQGHVPYQDIFATGGFLFYGIIALSYLLGSSLWLMLVEFLAFYMSGIYLYKIISFLTDKSGMGMTFTLVFYLLNLGFGFGNLYPIQWAFPFILNALWFLTKYFTGYINDEAFVIYGFFGTLAALLEPRSLIFWILSFVAIGLYNFSQRHFARGFYQLLCMIFGAIVVYYTVGYFVFNMGNLEDYINQALTYNFTVFAIAKESLLITLPYQILIAAASGLLLGLFGFFGHRSQETKFKIPKWLIFLTLVLTLLMGVFSQSYYLYQLLLPLPFGLILTALVINDGMENGKKEGRASHAAHRRKRSREVKDNYWAVFARKHFQLPILVIVVGIGIPIFLGIASLGLNRERSSIANYLRENTSEDSQIYVWDHSSKIYLETARQSVSQFPLPSVNIANAANSQKLSDDLIQDSAEYIIVNDDAKLPSEVLHNLKGAYDKKSLDDASHFTIYQKK
ncbi:DUF2079 domain-containing protein [Streptococcus dentasini]